MIQQGTPVRFKYYMMQYPVLEKPEIEYAPCTGGCVFEAGKRPTGTNAGDAWGYLIFDEPLPQYVADRYGLSEPWAMFNR